ncbi:MAG: hypothetical protein R2867_38790 [Caldilineaceae bacterium]
MSSRHPVILSSRHPVKNNQLLNRSTHVHATSVSPNILMVFGDDWGRYASAYRQFEGENSLNGLIETPNFDRIAQVRGTLQNAFVPASDLPPAAVRSLRPILLANGPRRFSRGDLGNKHPHLSTGAGKGGYHIGYTYKV